MLFCMFSLLIYLILSIKCKPFKDIPSNQFDVVVCVVLIIIVNLNIILTNNVVDEWMKYILPSQFDLQQSKLIR